MKRPDFSNVPIVEISLGEHHVAQSKVVIRTLLGSCISVCFYDSKTNIVGMNHFLLASDNLQRSNIHDSRAGYYGVYAMQIVINKMIKLGADKQRILCKVFGGGNVVAQLGSYDGESMTVGEQNIAFVFEFLKRARISVANQDVGGVNGRVIYFDSNDFSVYRSLINQQQELQVKKKETLHYKNMK